MKLSLHHIARIIGAKSQGDDADIEHLLIDSRKIFEPDASLFFALTSSQRDGHAFIKEVYEKGVRFFVVKKIPDDPVFDEAVFLIVPDTLSALQQIATFCRHQFDFPVLGITGSNGKTIIKEWLYQLIHDQFSVVKSPKSFNSQIGVPLSLWQMDTHHSLGIFEAGISQPGEMQQLQNMIDPEIGVLTNIGEAHSEGFHSQQEKTTEKIKLFEKSATVICKEEFRNIIEEKTKATPITWGENAGNDLVIKNIEKSSSQSLITVCFGGKDFTYSIPFTDPASIENSITCFLTATHLGLSPDSLIGKMSSLQPVMMRMELKKGINHCTIINDSYSADLTSLDLALSFLDQQAAHAPKTVILSDLHQQTPGDEKLYDLLIAKMKQHGIRRFIGVGEKMVNYVSKADGGISTETYPSTEKFLSDFRSSQFKDEVILVKGARVFGFEKIVQVLELKAHQTVLEINLNALTHNLKKYQSIISPKTKLMAMVKAFGYGSGGGELASHLQFHKVDYLGVAYADEGVELRKAGIHIPIMILNAEQHAFDVITENRLEPCIYNFEILEQFHDYLDKEGLKHYPIHLEWETGMNRLGFSTDSVQSVIDFLQTRDTIKLISMYTHLVASEDAAQDQFTQMQFEKMLEATVQVEKGIGYPVIKHISNSAAISRHPEMHLDMVRVGIGLYGINPDKNLKLPLQPVATLRSTIAQIKNLKAGESISYNRKTILSKDAVIATVRIGYADGYPRSLSNGIGKIWVNGKLAPVVGSICMDMTMIDVSDIPGLKVGDPVIIFGKELPVENLAAWADTISYEIMTGISQRVRRVYFEE